jgi:hypothetical protein
MIYKLNISPRIASESHGLYRVTVSPHAADSSDDKILMADFQYLWESTLMDTYMPAGMRSEGTRRFFPLMTVDRLCGP